MLLGIVLMNFQLRNRSFLFRGHTVASSLSNRSRIGVDLGLIHGRVKKETYSHLVAHGAVLKMIGKVPSWSKNFDPVNHFSCSITHYANCLASCFHLYDQINSNFLWGGSALSLDCGGGFRAFRVKGYAALNEWNVRL